MKEFLKLLHLKLKNGLKFRNEFKFNKNLSVFKLLFELKKVNI